MDLKSNPASKFIDIHAHLSDPRLSSDLADMLPRLDGYIVLNAGENPADNDRILSLENGNILKCIGLHPNYISSKGPDDIESGISYLESNISKAFALSEIGLDFKDKTDEQKEIQVSAFRKILELAEKHRKVCIIHSRKSMGALTEILNSFRIKAIIHNFEGNSADYNRCVEYGAGISVSTGFIRFKKDSLLRRMDINFLFTETDSPVLSPDDKINTPLNIPKILKYIADIMNMDQNEIKYAVSLNFERFFHA